MKLPNQRFLLAVVCNTNKLITRDLNTISPVLSKCLSTDYSIKRKCYNFKRYYSSELIMETVTSSSTVANDQPQPLPNVCNDDVKTESISNEKRKIDDTDSATNNQQSDEKKIKIEIDKRLVPGQIKPKKFALLLSYCGVNYFGLQRNADVRTIEGELFDALLACRLITQDHYDRPHEFNFQRAARTDKGVSAIKQILSCRLPDWFSEKIPQINELLPPKIRLIAAKKTTRHFDCKNYCDGRTYSYMMPSYALAPLEDAVKLDYRVNSEYLEKFNALLKKYEGCHNFFNFTSQRASTDPSSMRFIVKMECGQPFVKKNLEFIVIRVRGQSFMLHQIRKMIGLAIGVMRGHAKPDIIEKAFLLDRLDIPKAPGLGLLLEEVHYENYNRKYSGDGIHEALVWDEYNDVIQKFVEDHIYPVIIDTEINELSMLKWLQLLPVHTFDIREPGPPQSIDMLEIMAKPEKSGPTSKMYLAAALISGKMTPKNSFLMSLNEDEGLKQDNDEGLIKDDVGEEESDKVKSDANVS